MFCPRCGDELSRNASNGALECAAGQMQLSLRMEQRLKERFEDGVGGVDTRPYPHGIGGTWFCPACGVPANELTKGDLRCSQCRLALADMVWELIEINPHFP